MEICDIISLCNVFILIIHAISYNVRRSRCTDIDCLCINCKRNLMSKEELENDNKENIAL